MAAIKNHELDENKEWIDRAAYESRYQLLDGLADWYVHETTRIDDALTRITEGRYGACLGCHKPIEPHRFADRRLFRSCFHTKSTEP